MVQSDNNLQSNYVVQDHGVSPAPAQGSQQTATPAPAQAQPTNTSNQRLAIQDTNTHTQGPTSTVQELPQTGVNMQANSQAPLFGMLSATMMVMAGFILMRQAMRGDA